MLRIRRVLHKTLSDTTFISVPTCKDGWLKKEYLTLLSRCLIFKMNSYILDGYSITRLSKKNFMGIYFQILNFHMYLKKKQNWFAWRHPLPFTSLSFYKRKSCLSPILHLTNVDCLKALKTFLKPKKNTSAGVKKVNDKARQQILC